MKQIKPEIGWGIILHHKYLLGRFFLTRGEATNWAVDLYSQFSKLKTWRGIKKQYGISFVKCKLERLEQ